MSIFEQTAQMLPRNTAPNRLSAFTDRHELTRRFCDYINGDAPIPTVLFLCGMGGNGKTLLLQYLQKGYCRRLPRQQWRDLQGREALGPDDLLGFEVRPVATALLDLGMRPSDQLRPQEPMSGLFCVKKQFGLAGIATPQFDFAAVTYLHRTGANVAARVNELFPADEARVAADIIDALSQVPVLSAATGMVNIIDRRMDQAVTRWKYRRRVQPDVIADVLALRPQPDLLDELPRYLAADLNNALESDRHDRLVLFLDTYEAFWGEGAAPGPNSLAGEALARDEWVRRLIGNLHLHRGAVVVIACRQPPQWHNAPSSAIPERFLEVRRVDQFTRTDAGLYLTRVGIDDADRRSRLIEYVAADGDMCHPYLLGMVADLANMGADADLAVCDQVQDPERALVTRLLQWVTDDIEMAIVAMSVGRSFDFERFEVVGQEMRFSTRRADFDRLLRFSFITSVGEEAGSHFAVHRLLSRLLEKIRPDGTLRAHAMFERYYLSKQDERSYTATVEAIYHRAKRDLEGAARQWLDTADTWLGQGRFDRCRLLLELHPKLIETGPFRDAILQRVAGIHLGLGDPDAAQQVTGQLPAEAPATALLQARILFFRGDLHGARALVASNIEHARDGDLAEALLQLTEYELFLGNFPSAAQWARQGLDHVAPDDQGQRACWLVRHGEVDLFAGRLTGAAAAFAKAVALLEACAPGDCDKGLLATAQADLGLIAEVRGHWIEAQAFYSAALEHREACADLRGIAHSRHALGKAAAGAGESDVAAQHLGAAASAAGMLGDTILLAKVRHTEAQQALKAGKAEQARTLLTEQVLEPFRDCGAPFDIAHALLTVARVAAAQQDIPLVSAAVQEAQALVRAGGFGLLTFLYPEMTRPSDRILAALIGFALGDAVGAPWEGRPPVQIDADLLDEFPTREDWPRGSTTDDTAQLMLALSVLVAGGGPAQFLAELARELPNIRGAGPSTQAAVHEFLSHGTTRARAGSTNGAAMRALPFGWIYAEPVHRRIQVDRFSRTTHGEDLAVAAAAVVAALGAGSILGHTGEQLVQAAIEELAWQTAHLQLDPALVAPINSAAAGTWSPPAAGISLDAVETAAAVVHVVRTARDPEDAVRAAIALGGDTDTVGAIAGGVVAACMPHLLHDHPWRTVAVLPEQDQLERLAVSAAGMREALA